MSRVLSVLITCIILTVTISSAASKPNVIIVITDDQGYGDIAAHGNPVIKTPNLDHLHSESVRLTNYHVDPTCSPTRSALMTGRYSHRNGTWHTIMGRSILRRDETIMPQFFKKAGYTTHMSGKWHLGDNYPYRPRDRGFDDTTVHGGGGVGQATDAWGNDYFDDRYFVNGELKQFKGYCTDVFFEATLAFIKKNKDKPFFAYLSTNAPHGPFLVADKYKQMYEGKEGVVNAAFLGMITNIDENIGRLRETLKELGIDKNTILIFTTDNGTAGGYRSKTGQGFNAGMRGQKGSEYDGGHRVPFFMHWPEGGFDQGQDINTLTAHLDILPTLADLCGLDMSVADIDGQSLRPLLKGNADDWPDRQLITESQRILHPEKWRKCQVMTQRWRLTNGEELYDIQADPGQKTNIADKHPEVVQQLRDSYESFWGDVGKRRDIVTHLVVGNDADNPATLSSHDWFGEGARRGWNQSHVKRGFAGNGYWNIEVDQDGVYDIELRRWPRDADGRINGPSEKYVEGGEIISVDKARLKVADFDETKPVAASDKGITFTVKLEKGQTQLQTWFLDGNKAERGAFYVYVTRKG